MKKLLLFIVMGMMGLTGVYAQNFDDLKSLYVDGKYDKLVDKAEKYTTKEKTMNEPLPYLYMAKGLFKISQDERFKNQEMYKNAEMDALNKYTQYKKKDKGNIYKDIAEPFMAEVKTQIYEEAQNFYTAKNYKKSIAIIKKIVKIEPENAGCIMLQGLCEYGVKNKSEGKKLIETSVKQIKNIKSINDYTKEDRKMLEYSLIEYTNFLLEAKDFTAAKAAITLGYQYFNCKDVPKGEDCEHQDYEDLYNKVVNG